MTELSISLGNYKDEIRRALALAEQELAALDQRRDELTDLIDEARRILGEVPWPAPTPLSHPSEADSTLTLHKAIEQVLRERGNAWTSARDIANEVNGRHLYWKRDRTPVEVNQIHARTKNYPLLFEKSDGLIRLTSEALKGTPTP